jgi:hypothetical protein
MYLNILPKYCHHFFFKKAGKNFDQITGCSPPSVHIWSFNVPSYILLRIVLKQLFIRCWNDICQYGIESFLSISFNIFYLEDNGLSPHKECPMSGLISLYFCIIIRAYFGRRAHRLNSRAEKKPDRFYHAIKYYSRLKVTQWFVITPKKTLLHTQNTIHIYLHTLFAKKILVVWLNNISSLYIKLILKKQLRPAKNTYIFKAWNNNFTYKKVKKGNKNEF